MKRNEMLNYEEALLALRSIISQVRDPYIVNQFNEWINNNLYKIEVNYTATKELVQNAPEGYFEYHSNKVLIEKLMNKASTIAVNKDTEYFGYPYMTIKELSMMVVGRKK